MKKANNKGFLPTEGGWPQRSGGQPSGVGKNAASSGPSDPQVSAQPQRRRFSAAYKARIVEEYQKCTEAGQIGALLRREGLYSSALTAWRRQYEKGALQGLKDDNRGRKRKYDQRDLELEQLRRENQRLSKKLSQAELIIDIQKKVSAILGNPLPNHPNNESNL
jgi:transposase-like protein